MSTLTERLSLLTPAQRALFELRMRERTGTHARAIPLAARSGGEPLPVSFAQRRLWFLHQLQPDSPLYNTYLTVRLTGPLDGGALERSLVEIVQRNEVLRTTFSYSGGSPVQCIHDDANVPLHRLAFDLVAPANRETAARDAVRNEIRRPFDLERGPVIRALLVLVDVASEEHILVLTMHHIVSDRWSIDVLIRDLAALYSAFSSNTAPAIQPLPIQYADFAVWQRSPERTALLDHQLAWWKEILRPPLPLADLPCDHPRPAVYCAESGRVSAPLSTEVVDALLAIGRPDGATLFMTMLAATSILLFRHTAQDEVVIGTPIVNRAAPETAPLIGCFVNTLALRVDGSGNPPWCEFLRRVRSVCLDAYERQDVPFERLVEELQTERNLSETPLFQVMFALNDAHEPLHGGRALESALVANGLTMSPFEVENGAVASDLVIRIERKANSTECIFEYRAGLFDHSTVSAMVCRFETLLRAIAAQPLLGLNDLPALTPGEHRQVLTEWSRTESPHFADSCITAMVRLQAQIDPGAPAVSSSLLNLTRGELDLRARRLAALLQERGVRPDTTVGVCMDRTPEMVVALLGVLYAGAAYLPLDPSYPAERLSWILDDSNTRLVLTTSDLALKLGIAENALFMDRELAVDSGVPLTGLVSADPENLAYIIYTSGSTGRPKGVAVRRRGLQNLIAWHIFRYRVGAGDRMSQIAALGFDASAWEIWPALAGGAELFLVREDDRLSPERVWSWLCERRITISFLPTPLAEAVLALPNRAPSTLRVMLTGGDRLRSYPASSLEFSLVNHYGPSEYSVVTTAGEPLAEAPGGGGAPPIGRPIAHTEVFVLDEHLAPSPPGVRGQLYVGGDGLARGYLGRADLTAERFIPHPFSSIPGARLYRSGDWVRYRSGGVLEFLGRKDGQVKIRGFRVELSEIECVLAAHPGVQQAAVVVRDHARGDGLLVACIIARPGFTLGTEELRDWTRRRLPPYMVPAVCVQLQELPLSANGKVDRQALAALPLESSAAALRPHTPDEQALAEIWMDVLGCDYPGVQGDFFALGGHSLLATQLVSRIRSCLGIEIPLRSAFEHSTLAAMARIIQEDRRAAGGLIRPALLARAAAESPQLSFAQRRLWFIAQLEPRSPAYNIPFAVRMRGELNVDALERALAEIVRRHETLRSRFLDHGGQAVLQISPAAPLAITRLDLSAEAPEDREHAARRWCATEALRPFDLAGDTPFRTALLQLETHDHVLVLTLHHIAADGWSVGVLAREFAALYRAFHDGSSPHLPELAIQFSDYAAWQSEWLRDGIMDGLLEHWRGKLQGIETLELPHDHPRPPVPSYRAAAVPFAIEPGLWSMLQRVAHEEGATGFMSIFAGWALLLSRYSGQADVVVGTDIAGRDQIETEGLIGLFVNQLALRVTIDSGDTFRTLLRKAREVLIDAYGHQSLPFEVLVEALAPDRDLSRHPLFQCKLALEDAAPALDLPGLESSLFAAGHPTIKTDLRMAVRLTGDRAEGRIEFALDLFESPSIERMATRMSTLLAAIASAPDAPLIDLPLIGDHEQQRLLSFARGREEEFPLVAAHELFERRVAEMPEETAIVCEGRSWSYMELNARADSLASALLRLGAGPEVRVGICLDRNERAVLALLAVLKTGAAYVPMDPSFPPERLAFLAKSAAITILLTTRRCSPSFEASAVHILCLDDLSLNDEAELLPAERLPARPRVEPANLAYVIFTSGSTGTPKAVGIEHRNLVNYVLAVSSKLEPVRGRRFALLSTLAADLGNTTLFASLCGGGVLHVMPEDLASNPDDLAAYFYEHRIECIKIAPSHLAALLTARSPAHVLPAALLVLGGEASSCTWIRELHTLRPECRILNHYGPTETTVGVLTAPITSIEESGALNIPLGTPLANTRAYVLDGAGNLTPEGIPGELYLGGAGVARGYLNATAKTAERFLPDPFSGIPGARLYRTGDRARSIGAGVIEFLGRVDRQVKIRGYRVELGEIEAALNQHPAIAQSAVAVVEDSERGARVAAWFVPVQGHMPPASDLRNFLELCLPAYMLPAAFIAVPGLPLLANGKLDRRALPEPRFGGQVEEIPGVWRTPTEEMLAGIWASVLGIDQVGPAHNFFELGGHSLLATRVAARIREAFEVPLAVRAVFECRTLTDLAGRIDAARAAMIGSTPPPLLSAPREVILPLSFSEQRLWFLQRFAPEDRSYLVPIVLRLSGELSTIALERAFSETARRHEILRTCFPTSGDLPVRLIQPASPWHLPMEDLRATPGEAGERELLQQIEAELGQPFDLGTGPLLRTRLYRTADREHVLLVLLHHIISDAWSSGVLLQEMGRLYEGAGAQTLPPLSVQYADFAYWQRNWLRGDALDELLGWWRARLADAPPLELPFDRRPLAERSARGESCSITFDPAVTQALKACARAAGVTEFSVLLAGWASVLARFSGQPDLSIGTPVSGRIHASLEPLLGCFVNVLVLRCMLHGDPAFAEILSRVRETALAAWDRQELPFEKLVEDLQPGRKLQSTPLFQVMFILQNAPPQEMEFGGIRFQQMAFETGAAKFDLTLILREVHGSNGEVSYAARMEYRKDLFDRATVEGLLSSLRCLLSSAVQAPEQPLSSLPLLEPGKREMLLAQGRANVPYSRERTVHEMFVDRARQTPDAVALEFGDSTMRYGMVNHRANQLAHHLRSLGAGPEVLVAVCLDRSAELIVTLLAILKAGAAYLPLDPAEPDPRLSFVLADTGASIAVTTSELANRMVAVGATKLVLLDRDLEMIGRQAETAPEVRVTPEHLAYVMYTSGSTGTPKGVAVTHRAILRLVEGNHYALLTSSEAILQLAPVGFDASTFEIWGALLNGARLAIFPPGVPLLAEIGDFLVRHKISTLWLTAGLFRLMVDEQIASLGGVRQLLAGGDVLPAAQVRRVIEELPGCCLINGYGPTENTTFTCCHTIQPSDLEAASIPIGRPIANTEVFVLDENMRLAPPGARGELYAGGDGLARGYHARPDLTVELFVPHPFSLVPGARLYRTGDSVRWRSDGTIEFLGRRDGQIKIRGFRVEIGEIEAALGAHPAVRESAVVVRDDAQGNRQLVAFIIPAEDPAINSQMLGDWLRQRLPSYMMPSVFLMMDRLPLTANGKIDRRALAAEPLDVSGPPEEYVAPRNSDEQVLANIWQNLLGRERIGIHSNFFELGGHSLLATQLASRIERELAVVVPLRLIFENATISDLAETIEVLRWMVDQDSAQGNRTSRRIRLTSC